MHYSLLPCTRIYYRRSWTYLVVPFHTFYSRFFEDNCCFGEEFAFVIQKCCGLYFQKHSELKLRWFWACLLYVCVVIFQITLKHIYKVSEIEICTVLMKSPYESSFFGTYVCLWWWSWVTFETFNLSNNQLNSCKIVVGVFLHGVLHEKCLFFLSWTFAQKIYLKSLCYFP